MNHYQYNYNYLYLSLLFINYTHDYNRNPEKQLRAQDGENPYAQMRNQVTVSTNMIVSIFAMFGVGYLIARNMTENETTVSLYVCMYVCNRLEWCWIEIILVDNCSY